jgi:hypothetical protein
MEVKDYVTIIAALGLSPILTILVTRFLDRREKRAKAKEDAASEAKKEKTVLSQAEMEQEDKIRNEIWGRLSEAMSRNDGLSQKVGQQYAAIVQAQLERDGYHKQFDDIFGKYVALGIRTDVLDNERQSERRSHRIEVDDISRRANILEDEKAALARMLKEKEYELAVATRGHHSRISDDLPPGEYADEILHRRSDDRRAKPLLREAPPMAIQIDSVPQGGDV